MKLLDKNEKIQHVKNLDTTDRGVIDLLERDDYIGLDCGAVIRVTRPHIAKTLWLHDSDAERHGENEHDKLETFIAYNMRYGLAPCVSGFLKWRDGACRALPRPYVLYRKHEKGINHAEIVFLRDTIHTRHREECETHFLTDDEIKEMDSICDQLAEKFEKRLRAYWKRYGCNVSVRSIDTHD